MSHYKMKKILITGVAGFIGYHCAIHLLKKDFFIIGIDNMNAYYSVTLKEDRIKRLKNYNSFKFFTMDIIHKEILADVFERYAPDYVIHLAAQAGVRYSLINPDIYINTNIVGFFNVLDCCQKFLVKHIIFASSSSVYGNLKKKSFSEQDKADEPISIYAATKKADEEIAYSIAKIYGLNVTGLRFFSVYGPFGRPDMAYFSFAKNMKEGIEIPLFNHGLTLRDYTYIDDAVRAVISLLDTTPEMNYDGVRFILYNVANGKNYSVEELVTCLEKHMGIKAKKEYLGKQEGDVDRTQADITLLKEKIGYEAKFDLNDGISIFVDWFNEYYRRDKC